MTIKESLQHRASTKELRQPEESSRRLLSSSRSPGRLPRRRAASAFCRRRGRAFSPSLGRVSRSKRIALPAFVPSCSSSCSSPFPAAEGVPFARQRFELNICNASYFDVIQGQITFYMNFPFFFFIICLTNVAPIRIQSDAKLGSASGVGELHVYVAAIDRFLEKLNRSFGAQSRFGGMVTF